MPRRNPRSAASLPQWAQWLLFESGITPGQMQGGPSVRMSIKTPKPVLKAGEKPYKIIEVAQKVEGTRIPAPTMAHFMDGTWKPRQRSLDKLSRFYKRYAYWYLQSSGASRIEARRYAQWNPEKMLSVANHYKAYVSTVAEAKRVKPEFIRWGFNQSTHDYSDWGRRMKERYARLFRVAEEEEIEELARSYEEEVEKAYKVRTKPSRKMKKSIRVKLYRPPKKKKVKLTKTPTHKELKVRAKARVKRQRREYGKHRGG